MLFHVGAIIRLNELGILPTLDRISSVSGGSITAGMLAVAWKKLRFNAGGMAENLDECLITTPLRTWVCTRSMRPHTRRRLAAGVVSDKSPSHTRITFTEPRHCRTFLTRLASYLTPRTCSQCLSAVSASPTCGTTALARSPTPKISLARAVTASSAFPWMLSPAELHLKISDSDRIPVQSCRRNHIPPTWSLPMVVCTTAWGWNPHGGNTAPSW